MLARASWGEIGSGRGLPILRHRAGDHGTGACHDDYGDAGSCEAATGSWLTGSSGYYRVAQRRDRESARAMRGLLTLRAGERTDVLRPSNGRLAPDSALGR
jgi:hypothetical protein